MPMTQILWPIWWYSEGFIWFIKKNGQFLSQQFKALNLNVWTKYLFVPMFGTTDFAGKAISFGVRLMEIFARGFLLIFLAFACLFAIFSWLLLPLLIIYLLLRQFV
jgi:hypothetical protein